MVDWKSAIVSAISTAVVAGISAFTTQVGVGDTMKTAGIAAVLTFAVVFFTTLKDKSTAVRGKNTKTKMFIGQR